MHIRRFPHGQTLIELIMVLPILITFWAAIVWFARVFIIKIELMHTARHGIFWLAYNHSAMAPDQEQQAVQAECADFLHRQDPSLATGQLTITVKPGDRWHADGPTRLSQITQFFTLVSHLERLLRDTAGFIRFDPASITIDYALAAPPLLRAIPGFPSTIPLRGYCVCYR